MTLIVKTIVTVTVIYEVLKAYKNKSGKTFLRKEFVTIRVSF